MRAIILLPAQSQWDADKIGEFVRMAEHGNLHVWDGRELDPEEFNEVVDRVMDWARGAKMNVSVRMVGHSKREFLNGHTGAVVRLEEGEEVPNGPLIDLRKRSPIEILREVVGQSVRLDASGTAMAPPKKRKKRRNLRPIQNECSLQLP